MKKSVAILAGAASLAILADGVSRKNRKPSVKKKQKKGLVVVDKADGPTAIFMAGRLKRRSPFDKFMLMFQRKRYEMVSWRMHYGKKHSRKNLRLSQKKRSHRRAVNR